MRQRVLVTGGAGFIGSHLVDHLLENDFDVLIVDALSWGSNLENLPPYTKVVGGINGQMVNDVPDGRCVLVVGDVSDATLMCHLVRITEGVFHLASQTHVDRSYGDVLPFVNSNMVGAYAVLQAIRNEKVFGRDKRLVFVSTDEVYGDVQSGFSKESDPLAPRNIYSALKAGGDLLAQTYASIFKLDILIARPANNYGPRQFEEKLIPKTLMKLLHPSTKDPIKIYGDGQQVRDWLYVKDTAHALLAMFRVGLPGNIYNLGAHQFRTVVEVIMTLVSMVDPVRNLEVQKVCIEHVEDRIQGDNRYALNLEKTSLYLGWSAMTSFDDGLKETVKWYTDREAQRAPKAR